MTLDNDLVVDNSLPPKLIKAMAVIATTMHQTFAAEPWIAHPGKSKESCVLSSLAARDFLRAIGFTAEVRPVSFVIEAQRNGIMLHSAGIGMPDDNSPTEAGRYPLHMVTVLPVERVLIDTTLHQVKRPAWPHLPGIIALPLDQQGITAFGMLALAGMSADDPDDGYSSTALWLDRPCTVWRQSGDAKEGWRRKAAVDAMVIAWAWDGP